MKKINLLYTLVAFILATQMSWAQGTSCQTATTFCTNTLDTFPAGVGQPAAPTGNNYDCLSSQPNPAWFTFTIAQSGNISFTLDNTNGEDIDFILWGPFPNTAASQAACGNLGNGGTSGNVIDCSFSGNATEDVNITNAQVGEVYVLLVTNYSNQPTNIFSSANTGTGSFACDCDLNSNFILAPVPQNQGSLVRADSTSAEFVVCAPATPSGTPNNLIFELRVAAPNPTDSLDVAANATTIINTFPTGTFNFNQSYASSTSYDSLDISIEIFADYSLIGIHNFEIGVINFGATSCIQRYAVRVNIPGVEITANDTVLCPGIQHQIPLTANIFTASQGAGAGSYQWRQVAGQTAIISNTTAPNPTVTLPSNTANGDIFRFALTYTDSTGCITSDTIDFVMQTRSIDVDLTSSTNDLCNNGSIQTVQLAAQLDSVGIIAQNGTFTWTNPATLSNPAIGNPIASLTGTSAADSIQYIVRFDYGACSGRDTLMIRFRNAVLNVTPDTVICAGQTVPLRAMLSDTFIISTPNCDDYDVSPIAFAPVAGVGTPVTQFEWFGLPDFDFGTSSAIPIGFDFDFYCQPQDSFYINVNGFISFNEVTGFGTNDGSIPDNFDNINNIVAAVWTDLDLDQGGSINYFTTGTAPYRKLVINFNAVPYYYQPDSTVTSQIILYETTNVIEIHHTSVNQTGGFFPSSQTQGIEDSTGTFGDVVGTRNLSNWSAVRDAYRFTPSITYISSAPTYAWQPATTLNNSTIYNPLATPQQSTMYRVTVTDVGCSYIDSILVTAQPAFAAPTVSCASITTSSITFVWTTVPGATAYEYSIDGINWTTTIATSETITGIAPGTTINLQVRGLSNSMVCPFGETGMGSCSTIACALSLLAQTDTATTCDSTAIPNNATVTIITNNATPPLTYNIGAGAQTSNIFNNISAGAYVVTVTETSTGCTATANFVVNGIIHDTRLHAWIGSAGQDTAISYVGLQVPIHAGHNTNGTAYQWTPSTNITNPNQASTNITTATEGTFMYVVNASAGTCTNSDTVWLVVRPSGFLGMPSGFSPDGDNQNDRFQPVGLVGATVKTFRIFNRWGQLVYDNADLSDGGWDGSHNGQVQPRDTYIYFVEFQLPNESATRQLRGEVTLLR